MFATISSMGLSLDNKHYVIALGYDLPEGVKIEDITETPKLGYTIQQKVGEGEEERYEPVKQDDSDLFAKLNTTANVYAKGFIDGVTYFNAVYAKKEDTKSDVILEK